MRKGGVCSLIFPFGGVSVPSRAHDEFFLFPRFRFLAGRGVIWGLQLFCFVLLKDGHFFQGVHEFSIAPTESLIFVAIAAIADS